jgi:hypothetical protein
MEDRIYCKYNTVFDGCDICVEVNCDVNNKLLRYEAEFLLSEGRPKVYVTVKLWLRRRKFYLNVNS